MRLEIGATVGDLVFVAPIGQGGSAEVWEVHDRGGSGAWALKVLHGGGELIGARMRREAEAQHQLKHANLLVAERVLEIGGRPALLMPLIEGPSLARLLADHPPSLAEGVALVRAVAAGLRAAHDRGWTHRDIKPANVLLSLGPEGVAPLLADFGLARPLDPAEQLTVSGHALGTPAYAAPEQLWGKRELDARADLWSLGVLLHRLLLGRLPFEADSLPALLEAQRRPLQLDCLQPELAGLVEALLQVRAEDRLPSAQVLLDCLDALDLPGAADALRADRPLWRAARALRRPRRPFTPAARAAVPNNLGAAIDSFVGREADLQELQAALDRGVRLLSVLGPAGVGKTRIATELARRTMGAWPGGAWLCRLSEANDSAGVVQCVAQALDVVAPSAAAVDHLGRVLANRGRLLLVFDNLEHLLDAAAPLIARWIELAPELVVLVTSQAPLRLRAEQRVRLEPLEAEAACLLFADRARLARRTFALGPHNRAEVSELVDLLDRLPLAVELAAARSDELDPAQLLQAMSARFALLESDLRDVPARQRTLEAALDWSWRLLPAPDRRALSAASVFRGGVTVPALGSVLGWTEDETAASLARLTARSLLQVDGGARWRLLLSVQDFAVRRLSPVERAEHFQRHWSAFAAYLERIGIVPGQLDYDPRPYAALLEERDNVVVACRRASEAGEALVAASLFLSIAMVLYRDGPLQLAGALLRDLGDREALDRSTQLNLAHAEGMHLRREGRTAEARAVFAAGLAAAGDRVDDIALRLKVGLAACMQLLGELEVSRELLAEARAEAAAGGWRDLELSIEVKLSSDLILQSRWEPARAQTERARRLAVELGVPRWEAVAVANLGLICGNLREWDEAEQNLQRGIQLLRQDRERLNECQATVLLGVVQLRRGAWREALRTSEAALPTLRHLGLVSREAQVRVNIGSTLVKLGEHTAARSHLEAGLAGLRALGDRRNQVHARIGLGRVALETGDLDGALAHMSAARDDRAAAKGGIALGLLLAELAEVHWARAEPEAALAVINDGLASLEDEPEPWAFGRLQTLRARALLQRGERAVARRALDAAAQALEGEPDPNANILLRVARLELSDDSCADGGRARALDRLRRDLAALHLAPRAWLCQQVEGLVASQPR